MFGTKGIHLLFDTETIREAFEEDPNNFEIELDGRRDEVRFAIETMSNLSSSLEKTREFIENLDPPIRHILVLVYFEMLDEHLLSQAVFH
jgi:hypothetical protein